MLGDFLTLCYRIIKYSVYGALIVSFCCTKYCSNMVTNAGNIFLSQEELCQGYVKQARKEALEQANKSVSSQCHK